MVLSWEEASFFLVFVGFPVVLSGERLLFPSICEEFVDGSVWGRGFFPCHLWHSAHSVPERASCGTEYARGAKNRLLWYATRFQGPPVRRTAFSGTGVIFGTGNPLLWYAAHFQGHSVLKKGSCGTEGIFGAQNRLLWYGSDTQLLQG